MEYLDWIVLTLTIGGIVAYGSWQGKQAKQSLKGFLLADRELPWYHILLSVMATQASAITFLSAPGQAYTDGMRFVQFYLGLPIAMIVLSVTFIPHYYQLKVYTAYQFLEKRFDSKTRILTSLLFLIPRALSTGVTIAAPSIILSTLLGWDLTWTNAITAAIVTTYCILGGSKAISYTQMLQMSVVLAGMVMAGVLIIYKLPEEVGLKESLHIAGKMGKINLIDWKFDLNNRYNIWSGIIGGFFLQLSYFGTDQSQVQRYLSGKSLKESQMGLIMNGILKIPMQFFILGVGVMVFVFFQFNANPIHFNPAAQKAMEAPEYIAQYESLKTSLSKIQTDRATWQINYLNALEDHKTEAANKANLILKDFQKQEKDLRSQTKTLLKKADPTIAENDKDYVFIYYILHYLPKGLIGLLLAVILSAAMSSTASELNALGTITSIDLYRRFAPASKDQGHYLKMTKWFTFGWGVIAICIASIANLFENLIQLVNIIGSIFYGNVLGIFLLAFFFKYIKGKAVFYGAIITQILVILSFYLDLMSYLWLNVLGCVLVVVCAHVLSVFLKEKQTAP